MPPPATATARTATDVNKCKMQNAERRTQNIYGASQQSGILDKIIMATIYLTDEVYRSHFPFPIFLNTCGAYIIEN